MNTLFPLKEVERQLKIYQAISVSKYKREAICKILNNWYFWIVSSFTSTCSIVFIIIIFIIDIVYLLRQLAT